MADFGSLPIPPSNNVEDRRSEPRAARPASIRDRLDRAEFDDPSMLSAAPLIRLLTAAGALRSQPYDGGPTPFGNDIALAALRAAVRQMQRQDEPPQEFAFGSMRPGRDP